MIQSLVSKKAQSDTWSIFFRQGVVLQIKIKSTKCRTWPFFSTSSRIRRVVMFDERVFDEKSCTEQKHTNSPFSHCRLFNLKVFCFKKKRVNSQLAVNWYFHKKTDQM